MKSNLIRLIILSVVLGVTNTTCYAESLFRAGVSQSMYTIQPRSLFSTVRAKNIGDLVTVIVDMATSTADNVQLSVKKSSKTSDDFSGILNDILPKTFKKLLPNDEVPNVDNFGGGTDIKNQTQLSRKSTLKDTITAQVVQILPNGNLVIQGKKVAINSGEKVDIVLSGIVDPRLLDNQGRIKSELVANLQIGVVGKGTVSRSDSEGTFNKILRYLF